MGFICSKQRTVSKKSTRGCEAEMSLTWHTDSSEDFSTIRAARSELLKPCSQLSSLQSSFTPHQQTSAMGLNSEQQAVQKAQRMAEYEVFLWKNNGKIIQPGSEWVTGPDTWTTSNPKGCFKKSNKITRFVSRFSLWGSWGQPYF